MCLFKFDRNNILFISFFSHKKSLHFTPYDTLSTIKYESKKKHGKFFGTFNSLPLPNKKVYSVYYHTNKFFTLFHACDSASAHNWAQFMNMSVTTTKKYLSDLSCTLASAQLNSSAPPFLPLLYSLYTFFLLTSPSGSISRLFWWWFMNFQSAYKSLSLFTLHITKQTLCKPIWCLRG